jgi:uridine kinase
MVWMGLGPGAVAEVLSRMPGPGVGRVVLVCVEGLGGAGKSVLAGALAGARPDDVCLVHGDDFYGPEERDWQSWSARKGYERYFDHRRLEGELLRPLRAGAIARFQRYDWVANRLDGWVEVHPRGVVIVEGVYLLREWLRPYWDFAVYVDTPREIRQGRLRERGENDEGWISRWTAAEDYYEMAEAPAASADLVVRGY